MTDYFYITQNISQLAASYYSFQFLRFTLVWGHLTYNITRKRGKTMKQEIIFSLGTLKYLCNLPVLCSDPFLDAIFENQFNFSFSRSFYLPYIFCHRIGVLVSSLTLSYLCMGWIGFFEMTTQHMINFAFNFLIFQIRNSKGSCFLDTHQFIIIFSDFFFASTFLSLDVSITNFPSTSRAFVISTVAVLSAPVNFIKA